jgi:hypothetical protein
MASRKSIFTLLATTASISAMALVHGGDQPRPAIRRQPSYDQIHVDHGIPRETQFRESYGKIRLPADLAIDLAKAENGGPVAIIVSAASLIPVSSGVITLRVPQIGTEPESTEVLWSRTPLGFVAEAAEYMVDGLPVGKYRFVAIFEFTRNRKNARKLALSKSLYLDVRPTTVLSSNVSFNHIKRVELWRQLEERVVATLRPGLATAGPRKMASEITLIKARDPGLIARKIAELRATDPEVARRIMELNQVEAETTEGTGTVEKSRKAQLPAESETMQAPSPTYRGQPAFEKAVPVRQRRGE